MKKVSVGMALFLSVLVTPLTQDRGPRDLIVVVDTSASMSGSAEDIRYYLSGPFLRDFLRIGDTFHLISFAGTPRTEIARRIEGIGDVETIIGRILLLYPLEPYSDINGALDYLETYVAHLPETRTKQAVFVSDGEQHSPGGGTPDPGALQSRINASSARLRDMRTDLRMVKVPDAVAGLAAANRPPRERPAPPTSPSPVSTPAAQTTPPPVQTTSNPAAPVPGQTAPPIQTVPNPASPVQTAPPSPTMPNPAASTPARATPSPQTTPASPAAPAQIAAPVQGAPSPVVSPPARTAPGPGTPPPVQTTPSPQTTPASPAAPAQIAAPVQGTPSPVVSPPARTAPGPGTPPPVQTAPSPQTTPGPAASPQTAPSPVDRAPPEKNTVVGGTPIPLPLFLTLGAGAVLGLLGFSILLVLKRLHASPNRAMTYMMDRTVPRQGANPDKAWPDPQNGENKELLAAIPDARQSNILPPQDQPQNILTPGYRDTIMLNLFVEDQNTAIGRRNIHALKSGAVLTIGGGNSDFLIFLVSLPPHLAELHFDGRQCSFIPKKPRFFPDLDDQVIPDCLGKNIRLVSERNYELLIRIEQYENPLDRLDLLLRSFITPGVS